MRFLLCQQVDLHLNSLIRDYGKKCNYSGDLMNTHEIVTYDTNYTSAGGFFLLDYIE
jgi:hypothetical protein